MNNILLCGFMGCGKTTVGRMLAQLLAMSYLDLDEEIEKTAGESISALFARFGEDDFRDREHAAILSLAAREDCVVATGGGAMTFSRNREAVSPQDVCILLDAPFSLCYARIRDSDRPLVHSHTPEQLRELYGNRLAAYRTVATLTVDASQPPAQVAQTAAQVYQRWKQAHAN